MAAPKKSWSFTKAVLRALRSGYTPPWMMPYSDYTTQQHKKGGDFRL